MRTPVDFSYLICDAWEYRVAQDTFSYLARVDILRGVEDPIGLVICDNISENIYRALRRL